MLFDDWLKEQKLNYTQASQRFGVSRITIYYWATGRNRPSPKFNNIIYEKTRGQVTANDHHRAYELAREYDDANI